MSGDWFGVARFGSRVFRRASGVAVLVSVMLTAGAAPGQGLSPNSCWGRCGGDARNASNRATCGCDNACQTRGDCCSDKHAYCPVKAVRSLCPLTKQDATIGFFGTDLGWSFEHKNKLEILRGLRLPRQRQQQVGRLREPGGMAPGQRAELRERV